MKQKTLVITLLFLNLTILSQSKSVLAKSYYAKAEKEFEAKNYSSSLKMLDQAKAYLEGSTYPKIEYLFVMNHFKLNNYFEADIHLIKYFNLNPSEDSSMYIEILEVLPDIKIKAKKNKAFIELNSILNKIAVLERKGYKYNDFSVSSDGYFYWRVHITKSGSYHKFKLNLDQNFMLSIKEYENRDLVSLRFDGNSVKYLRKVNFF